MSEKPTLGICLGHQLISEAVGAKTYKMKFGHHGVNHPVRDEQSGHVFVTSQNHGFAVEEGSLPHNVTVWLKNANDGSIEGIKLSDRPVMSAQFHPEAAPGPRDARWIFDEFIELVRSAATSATGS
jgi:carbamoyl-phosphate synthase small subunit